MQQETKYYTCEYCFEEYIPTRRRAQKYCSDTCRNKSYHARKQAKTKQEGAPNVVNTNLPLPTPNKDKVNVAGITNAALGIWAVNAVTNALTKNENKAATKKDLAEILGAIKGRYHYIKNMDPAPDGRMPYYDIVEQAVVYLYPIQTRAF